MAPQFVPLDPINRRQPIIWTNDGLVPWLIRASLYLTLHIEAEQDIHISPYLSPRTNCDVCLTTSVTVWNAGDCLYFTDADVALKQDVFVLL